ncbi:MAG: AsnC family transcriptional [Beijerinckiaceae bacterium]|nr:MAG: AsnC family transcriptional [Beijerinckiaceae bacterium]
MKPVLDVFDRQILEALRANARLSNLELAEIVPLSHSAISRRIRQMEATGIIRGYATRLDATAMGEGMRAFAAVQRQAHVPAIDVARALEAIPGVVGCWIVSGDSDIMIEIAARDMADFSATMLGQIQVVPGVAGTRTSFILNAVKER